jgi:hypothetical protein
MVIALAWVTCQTHVSAHEIRPAYLQVNETSPAVYDVYWKVPSTGERVLDVQPQFAGDLRMEDVGETFLDGFVVYRYRLAGTRSLPGSRLTIRNLPNTTIDVLAHVNQLDGREYTFLLHPTSNTVIIPPAPSSWNVVATYTTLGIEHILLGIDHLLFVLALVLLVKGWKRLLGTITAFTVAHSITLALATLGIVHVPGPPVEACIALSIVFVAAEIVRSRHGQPGITEQAPWLIALVFGLMHGLGFAGALSEIGLPQQAIPLALLFFNVGVELGQIAFVVVVLVGIAGIRRLSVPLASWGPELAAYAIGSIAMFWVIERIGGFVS